MPGNESLLSVLEMMLQATTAVEDLQCFFTKVPFTDEILGLPLTYTRNPKTRQVEYIMAGLDLVSQDAVQDLGVTKTLDGDEIQAWLPLYLSHDHWERVKVAFFLKQLKVVTFMALVADCML